MGTIPTTVLGQTGLRITKLGYGSGARKRYPSDEQWGPLLNGVLDSGINFIDTANDYGIGQTSAPAEEQIGRHLGTRRSEYYLATKCGCTPQGSHLWTRENAFRGLHESLQRLKTDYIDLMQLHNAPADQCRSEGLVEALQDMQRQGKVRWIGVSTTLPDLREYLEWDVFDAFQIPYSALESEHEEWITRAAQAGTGIIVRGGVAQGESEVSGRTIEAEREHEERIQKLAWYRVARGGAAKWTKFHQAKLDDLLEPGESRTSFVLRYTLAHPHAHTNIVGTSCLEHLEENVQGILRGPLSDDVYVEAKRRLDSIGSTPESSA